MSKLATEIARLEKLEGLKSRTVDGETIVLDSAAISRKLARLKRRAGRIKNRPLVQEVNIGGTR